MQGRKKLVTAGYRLQGRKEVTAGYKLKGWKEVTVGLIFSERNQTIGY